MDTTGWRMHRLMNSFVVMVSTLETSSRPVPRPAWDSLRDQLLLVRMLQNRRSSGEPVEVTVDWHLLRILDPGAARCRPPKSRQGKYQGFQRLLLRACDIHSMDMDN